MKKITYFIQISMILLLISCSDEKKEDTGGDDSVTNGPVTGIDISEWQESLLENPDAFNGLSFVICRATYGAETDTAFNSNWELISKKLDVAGGMYHYYYGDLDPKLQADAFSQKLQALSADDLPPIVDIEDESFCGICNDSLKLEDLKNFIMMIEETSGRVPVLYVNLSCGSECLVDQFFSQYPLYVAYYDSTATEPMLPTGWQKNGWVFWQKNPLHKTLGEDTDYDVFNGNREEFNEFIKKSNK